MGICARLVRVGVLDLCLNNIFHLVSVSVQGCPDACGVELAPQLQAKWVDPKLREMTASSLDFWCVDFLMMVGFVMWKPVLIALA